MPKVNLPGVGVADIPNTVPADQANQAVVALYQQQPNQWLSNAFPQAQKQKLEVVDELPAAARVAGNEEGAAGYTPPAWMPGLLPSIAGKGGTSYILSAKARFGTTNPDRTQIEELNHTAGHEIAHVIWDNITDDQRNSWRQLFNKHKSISDEWYANRPDHAFADVYGEYIARPGQIQKTYPEVFKFLSDLSKKTDGQISE